MVQNAEDMIAEFTEEKKKNLEKSTNSKTILELLRLEKFLEKHH